MTILQSDNVKLYQKIKFVESYPKEQQKLLYQQKLNPDFEIGRSESSSVEDKYRPLYEESVNPFVSFNKRVTSSKYKGHVFTVESLNKQTNKQRNGSIV